VTQYTLRLLTALIDECRAEGSAAREDRKIKPEIPERGLGDIPVRAEIELTMELL